MTDEQYLEWARTGGRRTVLFEIDTDTPRFLSTVAYTTLPNDVPANRKYVPVVARGFAFNEQLSLSGDPNISVGDIEIHNEDGKLDPWLDDIWRNRAIRIYVGDVDWPRADFRLEFAGVISDLDSSTPTRLNIVLRNKLDRLNTAVSEALLGGTTPNKDRLLPNSFGENHNPEPLLIDPPNHGYQINNGATERIIEVRDDAVPVGFTANLATGKFNLLATPAGTITVSVQGRTPYQNTVGSIVRTLATAYGTPSERFTTEELDIAGLDAFELAHPQPVGMQLNDRANVLQCCQELAASVGAQVVVSREGLLRLVKIALPGLGTPFNILQSDYEHGSLSITDRTEVVAGVRLGYCKNWTVQTTINTGIPSEHKDLYAQEWLTVTARDAAVAAEYRIQGEPAQVDTLLLSTADAQAEADRRLALWSVPRTVFSITGFAQLLTLELGQAVRLYGNRWDLEDGKEGIVIGLNRDWIGGRCGVEVLV